MIPRLILSLFFAYSAGVLVYWAVTPNPPWYAALSLLSVALILITAYLKANHAQQQADCIRDNQERTSIKDFREREASIVRSYRSGDIDDRALMEKLRKIEPEKPAGWRSLYSDLRRGR